ncbi:hypothetical protein [Actinophytocola sp.]|uniref:hypothetical protein n=1 Tax=Actinophytocola sp. TaxID=1872138 RepID=UPI00389B225B
MVDEGEVLGFGYVRAGSPRSACDRLLLVGDGSLDEPPARLVPDNAESVRVLAAAPMDRIPDERVHRAVELDSGLPAMVTETLAQPGSPWCEVAGPLIEQVRASRHLVWLAGGFARDVLGGAAADVNDLDLAGTMPPGRFTELTKRIRRRAGLEFRPKVSPNTLVCSAEPPSGGDRLYEYRTLKLAGLRFPASGSDLDTDACCRDFTVNSLYYDPVDDIVIDPTGRGWEDLNARPRRLTSRNQSEDLADWAHVVMRAVKFAARWAGTIGINVDELRVQLAALPADLRAKLSRSAWERLVRKHGETFEDVGMEQQLEVAETLGPVAVELFKQMLAVRS